ncbi:helix-hairpin-helix domain-containing protein [Pseudomonas rubra]|uniref:Helix-hairpin-helix domain-containing protein n=1 Tax=Pseudomonas rubra TaxID=2942627 RepID=A0ABT5P8Y0_9PSED|nr:helix-hairpin-helix domain-containing protein [Pseudomonas rubra]MDD1014647.1 helix-hairpin-helix domain-containing protein [Pseudomonas rubra]MDD1041378.1 helix-hairpin-helix domain-containing protein [Pseudomonas rubra]MDD1155797.1 helix-hairpin-helix domain-containing protein [Pseudomonas rubra]
MPFSPNERTALLALKGVGPTVIARLEQMGIDSLAELGKSDVSDILAQASAASGSTCWKNSPQARAAISVAVELARVSLQDEALPDPETSMENGAR